MSSPPPGAGADRLLLVATSRWISSAQLAIAFADLDWAVEAVCPGGHPLEEIKAVHRTHRFRALSPISSLRRAILRARPQLVLALDDLGASHLQRLYKMAERRQTLSVDWQLLFQTLRRALPSGSSYAVVRSRAALADLAKAHGVAVPSTTGVADESQLKRIFACAGGRRSVVLKADETSGGEGVRLAHSAEEAVAAYRELRRPVGLARVLKRAVFDRDLNTLVPWVARRSRRVSVQAVVEGPDANLAVACWRGEVLALIAAEVLAPWRQHGPSAVIRLIDNEAMAQAACRLVRALDFSGLCGLDFILDRTTGKPYLIELNGRATPTCHLALGVGRDLVAALSQAVRADRNQSGDELTEPGARSVVTSKDIIALFPLAWHLETESAFLSCAYRDLPFGEQALIAAGLRPMRSPALAWWHRRFNRLSRALAPATRESL